jgi:uncharacterized heparinase superfamily protein
MARRRTEPGIGDRWAARRAGWHAGPARIVHWPDPDEAGTPLRGRALVDGVYWAPDARAGAVALAIPDGDLWALEASEADLRAALHGHEWLDDLAALGSRAAARTALRWLSAWDAAFGTGRGPGWTAGRAARRVLAWTGHLDFLAGGAGGALPETIARALDQHIGYLRRRGGAARQGLDPIAVPAAILLAGLVLDGRAGDALTALPRLVGAVERVLRDPAAATGRSPWRLLRLAILLRRVRVALIETGHTPPEALAEALARLAPDLRALSHADGGLSRFHGGARGVPGALDRTLAEAPAPARPNPRPVMGYGRLAASGVTAILDAGPAGAVDSRLAVELTVGRTPLVVAAGTGLAIPAPPRPGLAAAPQLEARPGHLLARLQGGVGLDAERQLWLEPGGGRLAGRDRLALRRPPGAPVPELWLRFALHPGIRVEEAGPGAAILWLPGGGHWLFAHDGPAERTFEPFAHADPTDPLAAGPRPAQAIVLRAAAEARTLDLAWMFERGEPSAAAMPGDRRAARPAAAG